MQLDSELFNTQTGLSKQSLRLRFDGQILTNLAILAKERGLRHILFSPRKKNGGQVPCTHRHPRWLLLPDAAGNDTAAQSTKQERYDVLDYLKNDLRDALL